MLQLRGVIDLRAQGGEAFPHILPDGRLVDFRVLHHLPEVFRVHLLQMNPDGQVVLFCLEQAISPYRIHSDPFAIAQGSKKQGSKAKLPLREAGPESRADVRRQVAEGRVESTVVRVTGVEVRVANAADNARIAPGVVRDKTSGCRPE